MTLVGSPEKTQSPGTSDQNSDWVNNLQSSGATSEQQAETTDSYVEFYQRTSVKLFRASLVLLGYLDAGKTCLVDTLLGQPFRETKEDNEELDKDKGPSRCKITYSNSLIEDGVTWQKLEDKSFEQKMTDDLQTKIAREILPDVDLPDEGKEEEGRSKHKGVPDPLKNLATIKVLEVSDEFSQQMFLGQDMVFLLVMDVTKKLDDILPESGVITTAHNQEKLDCPKTPREFLNYWLNTVGTLIGSSDNGGDRELGKSHESAIIVLTNTDKLDAQKRESEIENCKKEISRHIKGQQTCKHVVKRIIALSNTERDQNEVKVLRQLICKLSESKATFGIMVPCSWQKCEAGLLDFCKKMGRTWLLLGELHEQIAKPIGMSLKQLKAFLRFHGQLGNLIFADVESKDSLITTDVNFLVDAFQAIKRAWHCPDILEWSFYAETQLENEISRGILSGGSLLRIWKQFGDVPADQLASIMVHHHHLIPYGDHSKEQTFEWKKFIIPSLLPHCDITKHLGKQPDVSALLYLFHYAPEVEENFTSVFLPTTVFPMLVGFLTGKKAAEKAWKLENVCSNQATFRAGKSRELLVKLSACGPAIVLKSISVIPETLRGSQCAYSRVRSRIDNSIQTILQTHHPNLHCSICVTPCDLKTITRNRKFTCVEVLGTIDSIGTESLSHAYCHEHKQKTEIKDFSCWFCDKCDSRESDLDYDKVFRIVIKKVISKIPNLGTLIEVADTLGMEEPEVLQAYNDSYQKIRDTSREVLRNWLNRVNRADGSHHKLLCQLEAALQGAGVSVDLCRKEY